MTHLLRAVLCVFFALTGPPVAGAQRAEHPAGRYVELEGARLWVEEEGSGEPLVLIAGGPGLSHAYFHPWFSALSDTYRIIYFDALGCGKSSRAPHPAGYSLAADVEHLEALRVALNLGRINIFGHSYGGMVGAAYTSRFPQSVGRLILANAISSGGELQLIQDNWNDQFRKQMPEAWAKVQTLRKRGVRSSHPAHQAAYAMPGALLFFRDASNAMKQPVGEPDLYNPEIWYAIAGRDADFNVSGEMRRFDMRQKLAQVTQPVLTIAGRFDRVVYPELAVRYRIYAPRAQFVMFEKSGHFPFIEEPRETFEVLRAFLSR